MQQTADYIGMVLPCLCAAAAPVTSYISYYFPHFKSIPTCMSDLHFFPGAVSVVYGAKFGIRERRPRSCSVSARFCSYLKNLLENLVFRPFRCPWDAHINPSRQLHRSKTEGENIIHTKFGKI